jgi:thiamine biosynthesis protein ThiS
MEIKVNGEFREIPENTTVVGLLGLMNITDKSSVAVAVNMQVVSRYNWDATYLKPNDNVLLIEASHGG